VVQTVPEAWFGPRQQPFNVGSVAGYDVDAARDDQQPVGQWLLQAADENDRHQRGQNRAEGDNPKASHRDAKNNQGAQGDRPGHRQNHA
jgi:hypothetical protein